MAHWDKQAQSWQFLGPPLKPCDIDMNNLQVWIDEASCVKKKPLTVLLLGATPEIVALNWARPVTFIAVDLHVSMLKHVLPTYLPSIKPIALLANWLSLPIQSQSVDMVLGDGCYSSLLKNEYSLMTQEIKRVLKPNGLLIMRFFLATLHPCSLDTLKSKVLSGELTNFNMFKLSLATLLQKNFAEGIALKKIWQCWSDHFKKKCVSIWPDDIVRTINHYQESEFAYTFPTLNEVREILDVSFKNQEIFFPTYDMGAQCPTIKFKANSF